MVLGYSQPKEKLIYDKTWKAKTKQKPLSWSATVAHTDLPSTSWLVLSGAVPTLSSQCWSHWPAAWHHPLSANPERLSQHRGSSFHSSPQGLPLPSSSAIPDMLGFLDFPACFVYLVQGFWRLVSEYFSHVLYVLTLPLPSNSHICVSSFLKKINYF